MQKFYKELSPYFKQVTDFLTDTDTEIRTLDRIFRKHRVKKILDVACGVGRHSIPLALLGYKPVGIDYSKSQIREARKEARRQQVKLTFLLKDANRFSFPDKFDAAICMWTTIGEEPMVYAKVIANVYRALKKGGIFVIDNNTWSRIPKSGEQFIDNRLNLKSLKIRQHIHDRFTEHFRVREVRLNVNGKTYGDLCLTHVKRPHEWAEELKRAGFRKTSVMPNYQIETLHHRKNNALIIGFK